MEGNAKIVEFLSKVKGENFIEIFSFSKLVQIVGI